MKIKLILETNGDSHEIIIKNQDEIEELYECIEHSDVVDFPGLYAFAHWLADELFD